jgi:hypothetical protein
MRIARLFDGRDRAGEWTFAPDRQRITDPDERARIAGFLRGGKMILRVPGSDVDRIEPANGQLVPMSTRTDGVWIWGTALRYYVEEHGIAPEPDFLAHIVAHEYVAPQPDAAARKAAFDQLMRG